MLGPDKRRVLLVGNEGIVHAVVAGLPLEIELFQGFSLMGQPRESTPHLDRVLDGLGLASAGQVGIVGWKYLTAAESDDPSRPAWAPAVIVDSLRRVTGTEPIDVTAVLMDPGEGLRARNSADQIAAFAWAALRVSQAVFRVVRGTRPGMTERDVAALMGYAGEPLSMHPIVASGAPGQPINGLRSPGGRQVAIGDGISCGIGYWGSLCCRAGLVEDAAGIDFFTNYVRPYFLAQAAWYATIGIGVTGGEVAAAVETALAGAGATFRPMLNPGHLISYDEWVHSPIEQGSEIPLASGMALQCDIIPTPHPGRHGAQLRGLHRPGRRSAAGRDRLAPPRALGADQSQPGPHAEPTRTHAAAGDAAALAGQRVSPARLAFSRDGLHAGLCPQQSGYESSLRRYTWLSSDRRRARVSQGAGHPHESTRTTRRADRAGGDGRESRPQYRPQRFSHGRL